MLVPGFWHHNVCKNIGRKQKGEDTGIQNYTSRQDIEIGIGYIFLLENDQPKSEKNKEKKLGKTTLFEKLSHRQ